MMIETDLDWTLWRTFLAILREGSLAAAARALRVTHPTTRRHLETLEAGLNAPLFTRSPSGLEPTALALDLLPVAEAMEASSRDLLRRGRSEPGELAGTVRISASEVVAVEVLPGLLAPLRLANPRLGFEIHPTNRIEDVLRGDTDIAIRMTRPRQGGLIASRVADIDVGLFAAPALLDRLADRPATFAGIAKAGLLIGYDRNMALIEALQHRGMAFRREDFALRSDNDLFHLAGVRAGIGIGFVQLPLGHAAGFVRLVPDLVFTMEVWLTVHPQLAKVPRIAATLDVLRSGLDIFARF